MLSKRSVRISPQDVVVHATLMTDLRQSVTHSSREQPTASKSRSSRGAERALGLSVLTSLDWTQCTYTKYVLELLATPTAHSTGRTRKNLRPSEALIEGT